MGLDSVLSLLQSAPAKGARAPTPGDWAAYQVTPEVQAGRDQQSLAIMQDEAATYPNSAGATPAGVAALNSDIANRQRGIAKAPAAPQDAGLSSVLSLLNTSGPQNPATPGTPASPPTGDSSRNRPSAQEGVAGITEAAKNLASGTVGTIAGGWHGLSVLARGGSLDEAANAIRNTQETLTYQPQTDIGKQATDIANLPMQKASEGWGNIGSWVGGAFGGDKGAEAGQAVGSTGFQLASTLAGGKALLTGRPVVKPAAAAQATASATAPELAAQATASATAPELPAYMRKAIPTAASAETVPTVIPAATVEQAVGKAAPLSPTLAVPVPAAERLAAVVDEEPVKGGLPPDVQPDRAAVLQRIGLPTARNSALTGDAQAAATDFQVGKYTGEAAGKAAADQFAAENAALKNHAASIIQDSGGTPGMDEGALISRGQAMAAPLDALNEYFQKATKQLYAEADKKAGGMPTIQPQGFAKLIDTEHEFAGKAPNQALGNGIKSYLRNQGIIDGEGTMRPITALEAEGIKQYINSQYSYETSGLAGKIKGAINDDVFSSAGEDVYKASRDLYKKRMQTLDNPNGVSKIMEFDPANPMNRATPLEKIPDTISRLSNAQYNHLLDVYRGMPTELQPLAQTAIKEIQAQWGERLLQKGTGLTPDAQWNAPRVTEAIKANSDKIANAFQDNPETLAKIEDLQKAGNILRVSAGYPGASAQAANAIKRGVMSNFLRPLAASAGGTVGSIAGPGGAAAGAWVGDMFGSKAAQSVGERAALKKWTKGTTKLSEVHP